MSSPSSLLPRVLRRWEIALLRLTLQFLNPLESILEGCSRFLEDKKEENYIQMGKAVHRCYLQERTTLHMQKLTIAYQLHLRRNELVARVRENRQLKARLQVYLYEEDAAQVNRDTLMDLHKEKSGLCQINSQLKSELSRTHVLLNSAELDIDNHNEQRQTERKRRARDSRTINNDCSCSFESDDVSSSCFSEGGTVKVYSSVSTDSFDSDSTWESKHQVFIHVSSNIPPKPD